MDSRKSGENKMALEIGLQAMGIIPIITVFYALFKELFSKEGRWNI